MAKFVNLTPHEITIKVNEETVKIPPSGKIARVTTKAEEVGKIDNIKLVKTKYGAVENLPPPEKDTYYLVSSVVFSAVKDREDVLSPDTSPESAIRDEKGNIIAVRRLIAPEIFRKLEEIV